MLLPNMKPSPISILGFSACLEDQSISANLLSLLIIAFWTISFIFVNAVVDSDTSKSQAIQAVLKEFVPDQEDNL
jgi:hypothetical protein